MNSQFLDLLVDPVLTDLEVFFSFFSIISVLDVKASLGSNR